MLEAFESRKDEVIDIIGQASNLIHDADVNLPDYNKRIEIFLKGVNENKIRISVVAEWNNGKSTLINALLGEEVLISKIMECTAAVTTIRNSDEPFIKVHRNTRNKNERILIEKRNISSKSLSDILNEYSTTSGDNVESKIDTVEIGWPCPMLDKNIEILDTPGVNSLEEQRSSLTMTVLPTSSAILMLVDVEKASSKFDLDFIRIIKNSKINNIFLLINKIDQVGKHDADVAVKNFKENLESIIPDPTILKISALSGLYGIMLKNGRIDIAEINKIPSLRSIEVNGEIVNSGSPEYADKLIELSGITELKTALSKYFERSYGLGGMFRPALRYLTTTLREELIPYMQEQKATVDSDKTYAELEEEIKIFEGKIPDYERYREGILGEIEKVFFKAEKKFLGGPGKPEVKDRIYEEIKAEIDTKEFKELKKENFKQVEDIMISVLNRNLGVESIHRTLSREYDKIIEDLNSGLEEIMHQSFDKRKKLSLNTKIEQISSLKELAFNDLTNSLVASGIIGTVAGGGTAILSTTSVATGFTIASYSTGIGAALPFIASNPVGWAVGAAVGFGILGFTIFRLFNKDSTKKEKLYNKIKEEKYVELVFDKHVSNMQEFFRAAEKSLKSFVIEKFDEKLIAAKALLQKKAEIKNAKADEISQKVKSIDTKIDAANVLLDNIRELELNTNEAGYAN